MKNYSELGDVICLGLRPQLASSGRSDGGDWREMESGEQKREKEEGGGGWGEKGRGREEVLSPTLPTPTPVVVFSYSLFFVPSPLSERLEQDRPV